MSSLTIDPILGFQITGLEGFKDPTAWEGVATLIEAIASFVMSQLKGLGNWIQGLIANWTTQTPEPAHVNSKEVDTEKVGAENLDDLFGDFVLSNGVTDQEVEDQKSREIQTAIESIKSKEQIGSGTTSTYMDFLADRSQGRASFIEYLTVEPPKLGAFNAAPIIETVENARKQGAEFVFIPIVFQSLVEPHIVLFTINLKENVIEYYDPKGSGIGNQKMKAVKLTVHEFAESLKESLNIDQIQTSHARHQSFTDSKNCGRFVMHFMKQRLEKGSFEETIQSVESLSGIKQDLTQDLKASLKVLAEDAS